VNLIVAGAGIVGCAIAHELARRGAHVRVFDPRGIGLGATRASAGILAPHIEGHAEPLLSLCLRSLDAYDQFIECVRTDASRPIEYERTGTLQVAVSEPESADLKALSRQLAQRGVPHTRLAKNALREFEPALLGNASSALLVPEHGYVHVGALTEALAQAAERRGATFARQRVIQVRQRGTGVNVQTDTGAVDGDAAIVAAGSWSDAIAPGSATPSMVKPMRGQLIRLRPEQRLLSRVIWGSRCYLVPWHDGSVLAGATVEDVGFDERSTAAAVKELTEYAIELVPALARAAFDGVHVGLRPQSPDELPVIGRSSTMGNLFYATGHYRNGVLLAPLTAALVADLVLEAADRPELEFVRPDRFGL
jgi:glycine oxidase